MTFFAIDFDRSLTFVQDEPATEKTGIASIGMKPESGKRDAIEKGNAWAFLVRTH